MDIIIRYYTAYNHVGIMTQERIDGGKPNRRLDSFYYIRETFVTADAVKNSHMVDGQTLYTAGHRRDGVGCISATK